MENSPAGPLDTDFEFAPVLNVGDLIARTYSLYFKHIHWVLILVLLFFTPFLLLKNFAISLSPPDSKLIKFWIDSSVLGLLSLFAAPTMVHIIVRNLREGKAPPLGESLLWGLKCYPTNFGYHFVTGLMTMLGLVFFIVPGVFVMLWYGLLSTVVGVEGPGGANPMERSKALAQKHMGLLFGGMISVFLLNMLACAVAGLIVGIFIGIFAVIFGLHGPFNTPDHWLLDTLYEAISVVFNMNLGIAALCCYLTWSREKPGEAKREVKAPAEAPPVAAPVGLDRALPGAVSKAKPKPKPRARALRKKAAPKAGAKAKRKR